MKSLAGVRAGLGASDHCRREWRQEGIDTDRSRRWTGHRLNVMGIDSSRPPVLSDPAQSASCRFATRTLRFSWIRLPEYRSRRPERPAQLTDEVLAAFGESLPQPLTVMNSWQDTNASSTNILVSLNQKQSHEYVYLQ
ncbi:hypothetical protein [Glutamicibacter soli]|uniref:hypothetical protein n=1 Tax=Glutamicibacter soli TaxID=453836 RepID=UPI003FD00AE1